MEAAKMDTSKLKKFAQAARRSLLDQVAAKLSLVLKPESVARREVPNVVNQLEKALKELGKETLIDKVAYIWFNRFCALRFMDVNGYNRVGILSPSEGQVQPEILAEAKAGHVDDSLVDAKSIEKVMGLLNGSIKSPDGQTEAYRLLIVSVCNTYNRLMPYLFQHIDDYTELLMPDDLLSENSILAQTREAMTSEACHSVEVIGWLYQFYISEKKDKVFEGLKKNKKITPENIPAATQLFTPHWIVRYLVENSLGRLWMLNNPNSAVAEKMDYYIKPEEPETDFLKITSPEELKICDPACGSGHMLTYAYDLLYAIYLDAGYDQVDIPELILTKNLYGIEIDERASELAAFALSMKAMKGNPEDDSNNRRRFFRNPIKPNICKLEKIRFTDQEIDEYFEFVGKDLFTADLREALKDFEEADNFGSLIRPTIKNVSEILGMLESVDVSGKLFLTDTHKKVLKILQQADYLSPKYYVVIANPPYMGGKGMNDRLSAWAKQNYPDSKSDLFAMFMEHNLDLCVKQGQSAMITMQSWMFLSSFENLRTKLLTYDTLISMAHLGARAFDSIGGEVVSTTAFVFENSNQPEYKGVYLRLVDGNSETEKERSMLVAKQNTGCGWFFRASATDFGMIPGSPIAYWVSRELRSAFLSGTPLIKLARPCQGMATTNNEMFVRSWFEVSYSRTGFGLESQESALESGKKWFPYNKGGEYRKWYGNCQYLVNYENKGQTICDYIDNTPGARVNSKGRVINRERYFKKSISWSKISSGNIALRHYSNGFVFDVAGCSIFANKSELQRYSGLLNSYVCRAILGALSPTLNFEVGHINSLPILSSVLDSTNSQINEVVAELTKLERLDWDSFESSWDFTNLPLLNPYYLQTSLEATYQKLRAEWLQTIQEMQRLEEENNRIFIDAYDLQGELTPEVPLNEITLTCNPHYRYGGDKTEEELAALLLADTMREFISYAVGCMLGRYSLDKPGLILANQGETLADYLSQVPEPTFKPDDDNVIPMIDFEGDWFEDDIAERFKQFLRVTFGEEHYGENLTFIEDAIGKDIRKFFIKDFYNDHVKRYKKRPIYWLFSSSKGTFNALIYMHRYRPDTASVVLNEYLREFRTKLMARKENYEQITISAAASQKEKTQALKLIDKINKAIDEVNEYERDVLYPLAGQNIEIDLDDGVKHNYPLFGNALKNVTGLSS